MASKADRKKAASEILADAATRMVAGMDAAEQVRKPDARYTKLNKDGGILMCKFTLAKRKDGPNPLAMNVNEELKWVPRGVPCILPWYFVSMMKDNIERKFRQEKNEHGQNVVVFDDIPSESFNYEMIDPAEGVTI